MTQLNEFITTNWELVAALFIILILLVRSFFGPASATGLGPVDAVKKMNHNDAIVVDVRTDEEFQSGHILNALHIPLGLLDSKIQMLDQHRDKPVIVSCQSGNRSGRAISIMKKRGFTDIYNLSGGIMAWQRASLPLTKGGGSSIAQPEKNG